MKVQYIDKTFRAGSLERIEQANQIIAEYQRAGYRLTLRQLYYQFVSRDLIANSLKTYKALGALICDARMAGLIDWDAIEDRTRNLRSLAHWQDPGDIVESCARQFRVDVWASQPVRIEVWIEKEALAGVFERACNARAVPFFCCRGYTSASEVWSAAQRFIEYTDGGQRVVVLHFGDHDPSGIDMSRDIETRLATFGADIEFERVALNYAQVRQYRPPPNPAKETDSRFEAYLREYGAHSWELDALEPQVLAGLVTARVDRELDRAAWDEAQEEQQAGRRALRLVAERWDDVEAFVQP